MTTPNVRSMSAEELVAMSCPVTSTTTCIQDVAFNELVRRARKLAAIEAAYRDGGWCGYLKDAIEGDTP